MCSIAAQPLAERVTDRICQPSRPGVALQQVLATTALRDPDAREDFAVAADSHRATVDAAAQARLASRRAKGSTTSR